MILLRIWSLIFDYLMGMRCTPISIVLILQKLSEASLLRVFCQAFPDSVLLSNFTVCYIWHCLRHGTEISLRRQ